MTKACGFIEAEGYVAIFQAVDAMAKGTTVEISGIVKLGGGLVAAAVTGDLATVEEALNLAEAASQANGDAKFRSIIFANPCMPVGALAANPHILTN